MAITAAAIMSALGLAASATGAGFAAKKNSDAEGALLGQKGDIDSILYQGALESTGAKAYLRRLDEITRDNTIGINNNAVSSGATAENNLAAKESANSVYANAVGNLLQQEEQRRRGYLHDRNALVQQANAMKAQQASNWMTLANNVASAAGDLGEAYLDSGTENYIGNSDNQIPTGEAIKDRLEDNGLGKAEETQKTLSEQIEENRRRLGGRVVPE